MMTITFDNAMGVYGELVECYYGHNGYGGHTAEIYCYRLTTLCMSYNPPHNRSRDSFWYEDCVQNDIDAAVNLKLILLKLVKTYSLSFADIEVDGEDLATWMNNIFKREGISHRVHVKIERQPKKVNENE